MKFPQLKDIILFENNDLIVVNKPAFLSTLDEREGSEMNMLRMVKQYSADAQICHRLDKETSGALIIAKNPAVYRLVSMQFEHRKVKKVYHAVINGTHVFENLVVDLPILNLGNKNVTISKSGESVRVNGANIVATVPTSNGIIYVIDGVLLPQ